MREPRIREAAYPNAPKSVIEEATLEVAAFLLAFGCQLEVRDHAKVVVKLPIWVGINLSLKSSVFYTSGEACEHRNFVSHSIRYSR